VSSLGSPGGLLPVVAGAATKPRCLTSSNVALNLRVTRLKTHELPARSLRGNLIAFENAKLAQRTFSVPSA